MSNLLTSLSREVEVEVEMELNMTSTSTISRRTLLKISAATGITVIGTGGASTIFAPAAFAQNGDNQAVCNANNVNIRNNYGLSGGVIGTLNTGDVVNLIGNPVDADGYSWFNLNVAGTGLNGWVAGAFLDQGGTSIGWSVGTQVHVSSNKVNLRSGAGLGYGALGTFNDGDNAQVVAGPQDADGYTWYKISMRIDGQGLIGWMVVDFLQEGYADGGDPGTGFPHGAWIMTTTSLNLRSGPGTSYEVISTYASGQAATGLGGPESANGYLWYKVEMATDGNVGWFAGEYLDYAPTEPAGSTIRVSDGPLNVRSEPGLSSAILITADTGATGRVIDSAFMRADGYVWVNIEWFNQAGTIGWVAKDFIEWV